MLSTPGLDVALLEVRLDRHSHSGNLILFRLDEWRMVAPAILIASFQGVAEISGHFILQLLQNTNDLAALRRMTADIAELARSDP